MVSGGEGREDDRWTDSSRDGGWMRVKIVDLRQHLQYSMCMTTVDFMLPPRTLHSRKYLFHCGDPSEEVTHQFYKQLYTNIIRDIDVSS